MFFNEFDRNPPKSQIRYREPRRTSLNKSVTCERKHHMRDLSTTTDTVAHVPQELQVRRPWFEIVASSRAITIIQGTCADHAELLMQIGSSTSHITGFSLVNLTFRVSKKSSKIHFLSQFRVSGPLPAGFYNDKHGFGLWICSK